MVRTRISSWSHLGATGIVLSREELITFTFVKNIPQLHETRFGVALPLQAESGQFMGHRDEREFVNCKIKRDENTSKIFSDVNGERESLSI